MNPRGMTDELDMLDARLGALGAANRAFDPNGDGGGPPRNFVRASGPMQGSMPMQGPMPMNGPPAPRTDLTSTPPAPPPSAPATSEVPRGFISDLRSWSSQFRFTPEMEYIKINRTAPALYKNVNATGWLCDVYQPVDEQYLSTVWGGGTYVIVAYQNTGSGQPREVARGYTQINGNPRAFRGLDGTPVPFSVEPENRPQLPGVNAPPQPQQQAPVMPMANGIPFPTNPGIPLPPAGPSVDIIALAEKFSAGKQDNKSLEVIQAAQQQNADFYRSIMEKSSEEQKQLRDQLISLQQQQTAPMQNAIEMYRAQMETRERAHNETLKQLTTEHAAQLTALRLQGEKALEEQRRSHEAVLTNYREEARAREQGMRDSWRVETDNLRRELDTNRQTQLAEAQRTREAHAAEIQRLREAHAVEVQRLRDDFRRDLDNARSELERERTLLTNELNRVRDEHRRDLDNARQEMDRRESNTRDNSRVTYEAQIKALEGQVATVREQLEQRLADMNQSRNQQEQTLRSTFDLQLQQRDNEITRLRDELSVARTEAATLRTELSEKRDPMNTLNEVATLTQTFQSITGQGQNQGPPREEEPKTFMAQLAKFAPAIGEHLIKPTMKPIAEVVETVRERERREEELRRDILLRRQAMQQRGAMPGAGGMGQVPPQQQMVPVAPQYAQQQQAQMLAMQRQQQQQAQAQTLAAQQQWLAWQQQQQLAAQRQPTIPAPVMKPKARVRRAPESVEPIELAESSNVADMLAQQFDAEPPVADGIDTTASADVGSPSGPAELAASPLNSLITKDLIDYVESALRSNTSAEDLASQLNSAVSFGIIDAAVLEQVKAAPANTLVELFAANAERHGAMSLASPRGEEYIAAIHSVLNR